VLEPTPFHPRGVIEGIDAGGGCHDSFRMIPRSSRPGARRGPALPGLALLLLGLFFAGAQQAAPAPGAPAPGAEPGASVHAQAGSPTATLLVERAVPAPMAPATLAQTTGVAPDRGPDGAPTPGASEAEPARILPGGATGLGASPDDHPGAPALPPFGTTLPPPART
jgi:hypothetical protein